jgi:predicted ABC-type ATPase
MPAEKQLWLLAGGNGAGKSTFYRCYLEPRGLKLVNADIIARRINRRNPESYSYQAASLAAKLRTNLLKQGVSFCFETVFSHPSKIDFVAEARSLGYEIVLVYIHLADPGLNQARVVQRVTEGGHDVPADKVISRIPRTMRHIRTALALVDVARLYDNSSRSDPFRGIAHLRSRELCKLAEPLPDWAKTILADYL